MSGTGFLPMPDRMHGELDERRAFERSLLGYNVTFLDDVLRGMLPHDLVLLAAGTGIGKTELALAIAAGNAAQGRPTHYFALEAEPRELERRRKYALIARRAWEEKHPVAYELNYMDWFLGRLDVGDLDAWADTQIAIELSTLFTFYRGRKFDAADLARAIIGIHDKTTLIVVDHLHYVDADEDADENRALHETTKIIRDVSLRVGRPILLVVHLRKRERDTARRALMPSTDDVHGSSNITKIGTQVITIERATDIEPTKWYFSPTFIAIAKDRRAGAPRYVALCNYNTLTKTYSPEYTLGRAKGSKWEAIGPGDAPSWAKNHRALASDNTPSTQAEIPHAASRYA